ncbi:MAG TPA: FlgD immunoglobulin-like domain containing protein, partial [Candidatus Edwardsbacteria bacterium]|nr:FlgD immunoglobulin-like domain containing protein [Candidatus Edwardsbacteria bacterium]
FKPDYCFILDSLGSKCKLYKWGGSAWAESIATYSTAYYSLDTLLGTDLTEIRVPFSFIAYDTTRAFKYLALALNETGEACIRAFPTANPTGSKGTKAIARYPYYFSVGNGLRGNLSPRATAQPLAIELSQFTAAAGANAVTLSWSTASENGSYAWLVERSPRPDAGYVSLATVPAAGSAAAGHDYDYTDKTVLPGNTYYYLLGDQDLGGNVAWHGPVSVVIGGPAVTALALTQCHPNPARDRISIDYAVPAAAWVTLRIYDICGRLISTLYDGDLAIGAYTANWRGRDDQGRPVPAGVYFYRLSDGKNTMIRKFTWLK